MFFLLFLPTCGTVFAMKALAETGRAPCVPVSAERALLISRIHAITAWLGCVLVVLILAGLAHAGFCAFTWRKFVMFDYGVYTNMIWNSGHGRPFLCLLDRSYLPTHLSFTLALLGPLFRVWNHPFLLWTVQWFFLTAGTALLARTAVRLRVPSPLAAAIAVFFVGYHFTQQALLSEFHGVCLYLLLMPWLYYCLRCNRRMVWLPWLLVLGVREDAAVVILPMLLYVAVRDRWRAGYVYAALSVGYMVLGITTLYPLLTGMSLLARRHADLGGNPLEHLLDLGTLRVRLAALSWAVIPALPFVRKKGWIPLLTFPSLAVIQAMGGGTERQYLLTLHYAAPVIACLAVAMVEAVSRRVNAREGSKATGLRNPLWMTIGLLLITMVSYRALGFLPGGDHRNAGGGCYTQPHGAGLRALQAALHIPREGLLICPSRMAGFCANRKDVIDWPHYDPRRHRADLVFSEMKYLDHGTMGYRGWLEDGTFGLVFFDGTNVILKRGADPTPNRLVLEALQHAASRTQFPRTGMPKVHGLSNTLMSLTALHWAGSPQGETLAMVAARPCALDAGDYEAVFLFSAQAPEDGGMDSWGALQVRRVGQDAPVAEEEIEPVGCGSQGLRSQRVAFTLDASSRIEAVVIGCRAELWLLRANFVRRGESWEL